jgi:hypothetical protein
MLLDTDFREGGSRVGIFGITKADQKKLYQDKFKCQVALVDTEEAEDFGDEQEVAVAEWTRGGGQTPCPVNG